MKKVVLILVVLMMLASVAYAGLGCNEDDDAEATWWLATFAIPGDILLMLSFISPMRLKRGQMAGWR